MASRLCFVVSEYEKTGRFYDEVRVEFEYFKGFAPSQKQKSIKSFHEAILAQFKDLKVLEISTKSLEPLGKNCSAFNLKLECKSLGERALECVFQSSKVFEYEGEQKQFKEILYDDDAREGKRCIKDFLEQHKGARLVGFEFEGEKYPLEPASAFYDYIYIQALEQFEHKDELLKYDIFTDIEFNDKKQINCQARSCAIYVGLKRAGKLGEYLSNFERFKEIYKTCAQKGGTNENGKSVKNSKKSRKNKKNPSLEANQPSLFDTDALR